MRLASLVLLLATRSLASPAGGDVLVCPGQPHQVLDYYYAALPGPLGPRGAIVAVDSMQAQEVIDLASSRLERSYFGIEFEKVRREIGNLDLWMAAEGLSDVNDDGSMVRYPNGCSLAQGAVRDGAAVYLDRYAIEGVSPGQIGVLALHEILYAMAKERGLLNSEKVRPVIRVLLQREFDPSALAGAVRAMGWSYSALPLIDDRAHGYPQNRYDDIIFSSLGPGDQDIAAHFKSIHPEDRTVQLVFVRYGSAGGQQIYWKAWFDCSVSGICKPRAAVTAPPGFVPFPSDMEILLEGTEAFELRIPSQQKVVRFLRQRERR